MENNINPRNTVLNMLYATLYEGGLSHKTARRVYGDQSISLRDRSFIMNLYFGVLERLILLDYNIEAYSDVPFKKIKPVIKNILRISLYQMYFMDSVPDRAALSEALKLAEKRKLPQLKGFINGVLRAARREGLKKDVPRHVALSCPEWIYEKLCEDTGKETAEAFLSAACEHKKTVYVSLNTARAPEAEIAESLKNDGCSVIKCEDPGRLEICFPGRLDGLQAFKKGFIYVQSPNSAAAAYAAASLCKKKDPLIIDVCAAPGGKSINLALDFPEGHIISRDKTEEKISLIKENISRLKLENITPRVFDALDFNESLREKADIVMADVPCSGLGVIAGKPDIKYRLKKEDIPALARLQRRILAQASGYVKEGGVLIYSTCTLTKEENTENAVWFAANFPFSPVHEKQYTLYKERADGFYAAAFTKN